MPVFWMHETTGKMKMRWYVMQFVEAMPAKPDDYQRIRDMNQDEIKNYVWDVLMDYGIDPF